MCGICGIYSFDRLPPSAPKITRDMCAVMIHRGPDEDGYFHDEKVALGMRRLSIIDLDTGHQPMTNEDRSIRVILNGEIYNFPSLRKELIAKGHHFTTRSDTEVLVHLYEEEGKAFALRLNGMFAISLWDARKRRFLIVRDRLGIKPLHYLHMKNELYFASEIKCLLQSEYQREIDLEAVSRFFTFEYIPAPQSIFKGIHKLMPGHMICIEHDRLDIESYWDLRHRYTPETPRSPEEIGREINRRLKDSVEKRLLSDVPLGVFLSGGVDSSAITGLMSEVANSQVKTFSIGFKEKSFSELSYAKQVADYFHTDHQEFVVESHAVKELVPTLIRFLDEPLADASVIPTYIISKLARSFVTVVLSGEGGDELFAGYDTYKAYQLARWYRKVPGFIRNQVVKKLVERLPASPKRLSFEFKAKKFISGIDFAPEIANTVWWGAYGPKEKQRLFNPEISASLHEDVFAPIHDHMSRSRAQTPLDNLGYLDLKLYLQDDLLVKADRMTMANSLELRVPFLDHEFVEYAATIPSSLKLKGLSTKYILKRALRHHLPQEILTRKKIGFDIPLGVWIQNELKEFVSDILSPAHLKRHGFFSTDYVQTLLKQHFHGEHNHRQRLWPLIIFQYWYNHYIAS